MRNRTQYNILTMERFQNQNIPFSALSTAHRIGPKNEYQKDRKNIAKKRVRLLWDTLYNR